MSLVLTTLLEGSQHHSAYRADEGFEIRPLEGHESEFNDLARLIVNTTGPFAAFPRVGTRGRYDCVHIIPTDNAKFADAISRLPREATV